MEKEKKEIHEQLKRAPTQNVFNGKKPSIMQAMMNPKSSDLIRENAQRKEIKEPIISTKKTEKQTKPRTRKTSSRKPQQKVVNQNADDNISTETPSVQNKQKPRNTLKVNFLGGVGEVGKNIMAVEYGNDIIIIDCGATFPYGDDMPGIDLVVPNTQFLQENKSKIRGIIITHGHEDHIGAVPYVLQDVNVPIYGSKLALALIENKLNEYPKIKAKLISVKAKQTIKLGAFSIEFIKVSHSIAGSMALAIKTPIGTMVHTGDFKIDFCPIDGEMTDLTRFAELGKEGVLLLTCESTNVERDGYSMSESNVGKTMDGLFSKFADSRIIVSTFASNIHRLQQLLDLAEKYKRKVTFTGRSMINVTETAYKIGELRFNRNNFIDLDKINNYKDNELLIISTGSQGEPMSALTRMAAGQFPKIKLGEHDCVIISASPIPGNEKMCYNVINNLYKLGCDVIYSDLAEVHASGHAYKSELRTIHALVKPKFFIPVHGEYRHLKLHKDLAVEMGMNEKNVVIPEIGSRVEMNRNIIKITGRIPAGQRLVDGLGLGDTESVVLRDRKQLSEDGVAVAVIGVSTITGEITSGPDIITRGLVYASEDTVIKEAKALVVNYINHAPMKDMSVLRNDIRRELANFFFRKTKRRPIVLAVVYAD